MNAGRMNRTVSIVKPVSTARSADGAPVITISTLASNVWAEVKPITGRETFINNAQLYEADTVFTMRYTTALTELCQIKFDNNFYDIKKYIDFVDKHRTLEILGRLIK